MTVALAVSGAVAAATSEIVPSRLLFGGVTNLTYYDPQPSGLIDVTDNFSSTGTWTQLNTGGGSTSFTVSSNVGNAVSTGSIFTLLQKTSATLSAPQLFTALTITAFPSFGTGFSTIGVGIGKDVSNCFFATHDRLNQNVFLQLRVGGVIFNGTAIVIGRPTLPFRIGFSLVGNSACLWTDTGSGWTYQTGVMFQADYNFETAGNLTGWKPVIEIATNGGTQNCSFSTFECGRFGGVNMRDMTIVSNEDGTPYYPGGSTVYFTATATDPSGWTGAAENGGSYQGVFTLDLNTNTITQTGVIFVARNSIVTNDCSGQIIYYPNGDRRILLVNWGSGNAVASNIKILHELVTSGSMPDLLTTNLSVLTGTAALSPPLGGGGGVGAYDPFLVYDAANNRYLMAYMITTGTLVYVALASTTDLSTWSSLWIDTSGIVTLDDCYEGPRMMLADKQYWIMAGGPFGTGDSSRIYNVAGTIIGPFPNAVFSGNGGGAHGGTNPWPMVFPHTNGLEQVLLTFDGTPFAATGASQSWGIPSVQLAGRYW